MTITELIAALEALRAEHGDLPVKGYTDMGDWMDAEPYVASSNGERFVAI